MTNPVREFCRRKSRLSIEQYPDWDLTAPLPRQPVPDLGHTLDRYLQLLTPVVSPESLAVTKSLVDKFRQPSGEGERLQAELVQFAKSKTNWVTDWWLDDMYLLDRRPLPINSSPGMVFPRHVFYSARQQLRFAAQLISGILDYKTILDSRSLPIDRAGHSRRGQPLCMEQYYRLFSSYRFPGKVKDVLDTKVHPELPDTGHIIVICLNQLFVVDVINNGDRISEENIYNQLRKVTQLASESGKDSEGPLQPAVGALTALPRPEWAEVWELLSKDPQNKTNLDLIVKSMFVMCLDESIGPFKEVDDDRLVDGQRYSFAYRSRDSDDHSPSSTSSPSAKSPQPCSDDVQLALQLLHGQGSRFNAGNRWYDKTMQFIISRDGNCGLNYEHSVAEGIAVIRLVEYILQYMQEVKRWRLVRIPSMCDTTLPKRLIWNLSDQVVDLISKALSSIDKIANDLDLYVLRYTEFGREFPKTMNMSPDSFIQLALQLAHYKLHNYLVPTYESASTRRFALGRVDNIRACSLPALEWCKGMTNDGVKCSLDDRIRLLRKAMRWQTEVMHETILGHGVDNHLLGLRQIASLRLGSDNTSGDDNGTLPDLFKDPNYYEANQFRLSTSQVPTTMDAFLSYGAVVPNGYGAAYNPHPDNIVVVVSCWRTNPENSAVAFAGLLREALDEMRSLVLSNPELARRDDI